MQRIGDLEEVEAVDPLGRQSMMANQEAHAHIIAMLWGQCRCDEEASLDESGLFVYKACFEFTNARVEEGLSSVSVSVTLDTCVPTHTHTTHHLPVHTHTAYHFAPLRFRCPVAQQRPTCTYQCHSLALGSPCVSAAASAAQCQAPLSPWRPHVPTPKSLRT